jgi:ribosomal protein L12E/L44/L45/RPP1/RPP2
MNADDRDGDPGAGADSGDAPLSDEQRAALAREQLKRLHVADVASDIMVTLVTLGYQKLGLTAETRDLQNLDDAHLAIEVLRSLVETVGRELGEAQVAAFRTTLDGMQMNYARVVIQGASAPAAAPSDEAPSEPPGGEVPQEMPNEKSRPATPTAEQGPAKKQSPAKPAAQAKTKTAKTTKATKRTRAAKTAKGKPAGGRRKTGAAAGDDASS